MAHRTWIYIFKICIIHFPISIIISYYNYKLHTTINKKITITDNDNKIKSLASVQADYGLSLYVRTKMDS